MPVVVTLLSEVNLYPKPTGAEGVAPTLNEYKLADGFAPPATPELKYQ